MINGPQLNWMTTTMEAIQADEKYALNGGPFGSKLVSKMYVESGVPVIRGVNLPLDERFSFDGLVFVSEEKAEELKANTARPGDVVFTQRGTLGQVGIIPDSSPFSRFVISQSQMKLTVNRDLADPRFIYYLFRSPQFVERISSLASSSGVPHINLDTLRKFTIDLPPLPTQQRIAAILSAYDDLIDNNTRRITILEEMARRLYEEWFVHFRFPGHEEVEFDGDLPSGWRSAALGDLVEERRDAVQPQVIDPETPYVGLEHIPRRSITLREWSTAATVQSTKLAFQENDILFGKIRPYFHKVSLSPVAGVTSSDTIVLRALSADHLSLAIFCISSEPFVDHATQTSNGTKMPRADWKVLKRYTVAVPSGELLARFNSFILPLLQNLKQLNQKNANLRAQRDLLLPKLVSGEIDVSAAEVELEAAE